MIEHEIQQILDAIPDLLWLRIFDENTDMHSTFKFDTDTSRQLEKPNKEADVISIMNYAIMNISERINIELKLGNPRFSLIAGDTNFALVLPIGGETEWFMALGIQGQPALDPILTYIKDQAYFARLLPLLGSPPGYKRYG
jgi:predicted regulator of Ras-like GTPase activity (Roadblock/LC7/MglB family)